MVSVSASSKSHAFNLAEQMERNKSLDILFTTYAYNKNTIGRKFVKRIDKELIPVDKIRTFLLLAFPMVLFRKYAHAWNNLFDKWVAGKLKKNSSRVFIGWSGMSLHSILRAKKKGMVTILERGSSHILFQEMILKEEYKKFGKEFAIHPSVIKKELQEYKEADYISVPSFFVRDSFTARGIPVEKLLVNPFGSNKYFSPSKTSVEKRKFRIVYLGTISIRKGLIYLFEALNQLSIPADQFEVWFIGSIDKEMQVVVEEYRKENWTFFGHINHYDLQNYLVKCDVGVQPSLEEGLSMVIPQMMSCGIAVIVTPNTGAENLLQDGISGMVVPIRDPKAIAGKIDLLFGDREKLEAIKSNAVKTISSGYTWDDYGDRYMKNILKIL